jgi:hypothetical protein
MGQNRLGNYKVDQVLNTVKASDYDALYYPEELLIRIYYELIKMLYSLLQIFQSRKTGRSNLPWATNFN